jgi:hypothetical protein
MSTDWFAPLTSVGAAGAILSSGGFNTSYKHYLQQRHRSRTFNCCGLEHLWHNKQPLKPLTGTKIVLLHKELGFITFVRADVTRNG